MRQKSTSKVYITGVEICHMTGVWMKHMNAVTSKQNKIFQTNKKKKFRSETNEQQISGVLRHISHAVKQEGKPS